MMIEVLPLPYFRVAMAVRKSTAADSFEPLSLAEFHEMVPRWAEGDVLSEPAKLIYSDCPWRFEVRSREDGLGRAPDAHYQTMNVDQLCEMDIGPVDRDALLAMWVYDPMLPEAFKVAESWGFSEFITVLFRWIKTTDGQYRLFDDGERLNFGLGYHTRGGGCEEVWLFKRGKGLPVQRHDIRKEFFAPVRQHSRKPEQVAGWLVDLYGDIPRVEMFARTTRTGWRSHGAGN